MLRQKGFNKEVVTNPSHLCDVVVPEYMVDDIEAMKMLTSINGENIMQVADYLIRISHNFNANIYRLQYFSNLLNYTFSIRKAERDYLVNLFQILISSENYENLKEVFIKQSLVKRKGHFLRFLVDANIIDLTEIPFNIYLSPEICMCFCDIVDMDQYPDSSEMIPYDFKEEDIQNLKHYLHIEAMPNSIQHLIIKDDIESFIEYQSQDIKFDFEMEVLENPLDKYESHKRKLKLIDYAARWNALKIFKFLLAKNVKISRESMRYAIEGGNYEIIHILEQQNVKLLDSIYNDISRFHRYELWDYLLDKSVIFKSGEKGEYIDVRPEYSQGYYNNLITLFLIQNGVNPLKSGSHSFCIFDAPSHGDFNMTRYLVESCNADVDYTEYKSDEAPVLNAAAANSFDIVKYLCERGADVHIQPYFKRYIIMDLASHPFLSAELLDYILSQKHVEPTHYSNKRGIHQENPIDLIVHYQNIEALKVILKFKPSMSGRAHEFGSLLVNAVETGNVEILNLILENGFDVNEINNSFEDAYEHTNDPEIIQILEKHGVEHKSDDEASKKSRAFDSFREMMGLHGGNKAAIEFLRALTVSNEAPNEQLISMIDQLEEDVDSDYEEDDSY